MRATYAKKYNEEPNIYDSNSGVLIAWVAWVSRPRWCMQLCVRRNNP